MSLRKEIRISDISVSVEDGVCELSAQVDGDKVFFRTPEAYPLFPCAEGFVAVALLEAMISNLPIVVDSIPVSRALHERLREIQSIYACWNRELSVVEIKSGVSADIRPFETVGSFFSAGVDSSHTFAVNQKEITHLIMCWGFDSGNDPQSWDRRIAEQTRFVEAISKKLLPVVSNVRDWMEKRRISWRMAHGLFLSSVGGSLGMKKIYIPASHTYSELYPWGTHPLSDPMWSTESTEVIHHGAYAGRSRKLREILRNQQVADNLQVCWRSIHENCGTCPKCVRTALAIQMLGGHSASLPRIKGLRGLEVLKPYDEGLASTVEDLMAVAKETHHDDVYGRLKKYYKRYQLKQFLMSVDRLFLGGLVRKTYRKFKRPDHLQWRVTVEGHNRRDV